VKILVLGGNGFLGSHLSNALIVAGHEVRVFDRLGCIPCIPIHSSAEYVCGDFSDPDSVEQALTGCDVIFHLISTTLPKTSNENPIYDLESNLLDTVRLLESARRQGVQKILFASSGGTVYGIPQIIPIEENHPTDPMCSYGISKLAIEKYLHLFEHLYGLSYCVLRIANPYGEGQSPARPQGAISVFAYKALRGETITVWGDGSVVRDYIYVGDVMTAFLKALTYEGEQRVFSVGSGIGHSINDILATIELIREHAVKKNYVDARTFDVPVNILDISRAQQHLEWQPNVTLSLGLTRTMAWLKTLGKV